MVWFSIWCDSHPSTYLFPRACSITLNICVCECFGVVHCVVSFFDFFCVLFECCSHFFFLFLKRMCARVRLSAVCLLAIDRNRFCVYVWVSLVRRCCVTVAVAIVCWWCLWSWRAFTITIFSFGIDSIDATFIPNVPFVSPAFLFLFHFLAIYSVTLHIGNIQMRFNSLFYRVITHITTDTFTTHYITSCV